MYTGSCTNNFVQKSTDSYLWYYEYILLQLVAIDYTVGDGIPIWKVALAIHICGWLLQFIGHGVFEGMYS